MTDTRNPFPAIHDKQDELSKELNRLSEEARSLQCQCTWQWYIIGGLIAAVLALVAVMVGVG